MSAKKKKKQKVCNCHSHNAPMQQGELRSKALGIESLLNRIRTDAGRQSAPTAIDFTLVDLMKLACEHKIRVTLEPCSQAGPSISAPVAEN